MKTALPLLDSHCHLDRYEEPLRIAAEAERRNVFTIAVTNLPSHFRQSLPYVRNLKNVRPALGLHPLAIDQHEKELPLFCELLPQTSYVGEVGLDYSRHGKASADQQLRSFRFVAELLSGAQRFVSIHARGAERDVLQVLREFGVQRAIFHWYSGPLGLIQEILEDGHYFSINPSMTASRKGTEIISRIPLERMLGETDGPYSKVEGSEARPWTVEVVETYLTRSRGVTLEGVRRQLWKNFRAIVDRVTMKRPRPALDGAARGGSRSA